MSGVHLLNKKGEVAELKEIFRNPDIGASTTRKREAVRRVVELMTTGVDTSALFPDMVLACVTKDMVTKKLIYSYLVANSAANPDLAVLSINTLEKECKEESPLARGLALRSLASLRLPNILEYLLPVLRASFNDLSPYVRKIAVLCTLEVFELSPDDFYDGGFFDTCVTLLRDTDSEVCLNALEVIDHVLAKEAGERHRCELAGDAPPPARHSNFSMQKPLLYFLLNRMGELAEVHQVQVINCLQRYTPADEEEVFNIMNVLEEYLQSTNSGVVIACCHAFFHLTENLPEMQPQVLQRLRQPLVACAAATVNVEGAYAALCHVRVLAQRHPDVFADTFCSFFCRHDEPTYTKVCKLDILACIISSASSGPIVEELMAHAESRHAAVATSALYNLGRTTERCPEATAVVAEIFLNLLRNGAAQTRSHTVAALQAMLRQTRDPAVRRSMVDAVLTLQQSGRQQHQEALSSEARTALVWVLGEFAEIIDDAPYLLEDLCADVLNENPAFRLQTLTAAVTLFFKRPPEGRPLLGRLLQALTTDFSNADVLDRAMLYYRLLREDPQRAYEAIAKPKPLVERFAEDSNSERVEKLFEAFDSLAVVYGCPPDVFAHGGAAASPTIQGTISGASGAGANGFAPGVTLSSSDDASNEESEDDDDDSSGASASVTAPLSLSSDVELESDEFQRLWSALPVCAASVSMLCARGSSAEQLEDALETVNIFTLASGNFGESLKLFLYAQDAAPPEHLYLVELLYDSTTGAVNLSIKGNSKEVTAFVKTVKGALGATARD